MSDAILIETARHTAGIAVRERNGFRFYASDARFLLLDNRHFDRLNQLHAAIASLEQALADDAPVRSA